MILFTSVKIAFDNRNAHLINMLISRCPPTATRDSKVAKYAPTAGKASSFIVVQLISYCVGRVNMSSKISAQWGVLGTDRRQREKLG